MKVEDLRRMREARMGCVEIARVYGCDQSTVRSWLIKFGLPTNMHEPPKPEAIDQAIEAAKARNARRQSPSIPGNNHGAN